jgi:hypothetical protein
MRLGMVVPVGLGREQNLRALLEAVAWFAADLTAIVLIEDGYYTVPTGNFPSLPNLHHVPTGGKHEPGMEQPRNVGVRILQEVAPETTHVWFLDSDLVLMPDSLQILEEAYAIGPQDRTLVAPYDWLPEGLRPEQEGFWDAAGAVRNDPRWAMFFANAPDRVFRDDLSAGLACFSGNLVWNIDEFKRVGGFWAEIHHGRCEDGELGLRAVAMGVGISVCAEPRGWHLWHPVNTALAIERNTRDVPMLNARHPWVEGADVFMVDRDGRAFDVRCSQCGEVVPTIGWWEHAAGHGRELAIHVSR